MVYVVRRSKHGDEMLHEMPAKAARNAIEGRHDQAGTGVTFYAITAQHAHRWVRQGGLHATALYLKNGQIRRAG